MIVIFPRASWQSHDSNLALRSVPVISDVTLLSRWDDGLSA